MSPSSISLPSEAVWKSSGKESSDPFRRWRRSDVALGGAGEAAPFMTRKVPNWWPPRWVTSWVGVSLPLSQWFRAASWAKGEVAG